MIEHEKCPNDCDNNNHLEEEIMEAFITFVSHALYDEPEIKILQKYARLCNLAQNVV